MAHIKKLATQVVTTLKDNGFTAYFAGGFVRDLLLGITSSDIDIATDALPDEVAALFPNHILIGAQFGVCVVREKGHQFEVATFRQDVGYDDGRRPSAIKLKSTPIEDAKRRDFTINGMFYDPLTDELLDFIDGQTDLQKQVIRTIGNPYERFEEDRLRMIRAVRFAKRFNFMIEEETKIAITKLSHTLLPSVSMERIWQEFVKMRKQPRFCDALLEMAELGLLQTIFSPLKGVHKTSLEARISCLREVSDTVPSILILRQLFDETELSYVLGLAIYLRASKEETRSIEHYLELTTLYKSDPTFSNRYEWAYLLASTRTAASCEVLIANIDPRHQKAESMRLEQLQRSLEFHIDCIKRKKPLCSSKDLIPFGVRPGKQMGHLLELAERIAITENLQNKEELLKRLQSHPEISTLGSDTVL